MKSIILVLTILGLLVMPLWIPSKGIARASTSQVVVITASPLMGNECVTNFGMSVDLPDELILTWTPASLSNGTKIVLDYGEWPTSCNDGTLVYEGNGSSTTFVVDPDGFDDGIFIKAFAMIGNECSNCYASGSAIATGEAGSGIGNVTITTPGLTDLADYFRTGLIIIFPLFFAGIGIYAWRHDGGLVLYLVSIIGLGLSLGTLNQEFGIAAAGPVFMLMMGLLGLLVYDQLTYGWRL